MYCSLPLPINVDMREKYSECPHISIEYLHPQPTTILSVRVKQTRQTPVIPSP
jgi:hypothetical protein